MLHVCHCACLIAYVRAMITNSLRVSLSVCFCVRAASACVIACYRVLVNELRCACNVACAFLLACMRACLFLANLPVCLLSHSLTCEEREVFILLAIVHRKVRLVLGN